MNEENKTVTVEYRTQQNYCHCCEQKLSKAKVSNIREFDISKENLLKWDSWEGIVEDEEDLQAAVEEFVYETISFFATNYLDRIVVADSEFRKVKRFVLSEVKR